MAATNLKLRTAQKGDSAKKADRRPKKSNPLRLARNSFPPETGGVIKGTNGVRKSRGGWGNGVGPSGKIWVLEQFQERVKVPPGHGGRAMEKWEMLGRNIPTEKV